MSQQTDQAPAAYLTDRDPVLARIIAEVGPDRDWQAGVERFSPRYGLFGALVRDILSQLLAPAAGAAMFTRLLEHFDGRVPTPAEVVALDVDTLQRVMQTSAAKARSVHAVAAATATGELDLDAVRDMPDDAARAALEALPGIGPYTAGKFLLTELLHADVLVLEDSPTQHAVQRAYDLDHLPTPREVDEISRPWSPWRSVASFYLRTWFRQHRGDEGSATTPTGSAGGHL